MNDQFSYLSKLTSKRERDNISKIEVKKKIIWMNSPGRNEVETEAWDDQWGVGYSHKVYSTIYSLLGNAQCDGREREG